VVTSNAGRAIYVVYSLLTIPIMTILISLMSDTFLSKFQKSAEQFGMKGGEDERYSRMKKLREQMGPRWKYYTKKMFRRKVEKPTFAATTRVDKDVEQGRVPDRSEDDVLREEIMEEVEEIRRSVDDEVDAEMGIGGGRPLHKSITDRKDGEPRRRRPIRFEDDEDGGGDADDEGINEEEVELAIQETRRSKDI
jgi:hypothetical protein